MKAVLFYLLQVIICSGVLYSYYHFFLRNKKFHEYNRCYLLVSTIISIIIPFIKIPVYFNSAQDIPIIYKVLAEVRVTTGEKADSYALLNWQNLALIIYCSMAMIVFARLITGLNKLRKIIGKYDIVKTEKFLFLNTDEKGTPFSFFNWLLWDNNIPVDSSKGQQILRHEIHHITQKHSLDILFMEIISAILWVNPFFIRTKNELKAIHEFSADNAAINISDNLEYAELLLQRTFQTQQKFVNPFFHTQIKRRIAMITNPSKTNHQQLRKAMVLPVAFLTLSIIAANCKAKDTHSELAQENAGIKSAQLEKQKIVSSDSPNKIYEKVEVESSFPDGEGAWKSFLEKNINAAVSVDNAAPEGQYTCLVQFIVDEKGAISDIKTLTNHGFGMEHEVERIMKLSPNWNPATNNGVIVKAYRRQPITFVVQLEE